MPYDPRPVSQGGNRGMDDTFSRFAPEGKYRVVGVDTFNGSDWIQGEFATKEAAIACAKERAGDMLKMYVYDDKGIPVFSAGKF